MVVFTCATIGCNHFVHGAVPSTKVSSYEDARTVFTITDRMLGQLHLRSILDKVIATDYLRDQLQKSLMVRAPVTSCGISKSDPDEMFVIEDNFEFVCIWIWKRLEPVA